MSLHFRVHSFDHERSALHRTSHDCSAYFLVIEYILSFFDTGIGFQLMNICLPETQLE